MINNPHADQLAFRAWLVKQLTVSRWSAPLSMEGQELADHLGVSLSVLEEAQASRDSELKRLGKAGRARGRKRYVGNDYAEIALRVPKPVHALWRELCESLRQASSVVSRSLIHHFLLNPIRPEWTARSWLIQGGVYRAPEGSPMVFAKITRGAQVAFDYHADNWNISPPSLLRGLMIDLLEGRTTKLRLINFAVMWGDPERYLHPEKFK